jgi:hypothetical protein
VAGGEEGAAVAIPGTGAKAGERLAGVERVVAACLPSLGDMLFACVLLAVAIGLQGRALGLDGDAGWSLRIGLTTLAHGLPRTEFLLSTQQGQPAVYWEWLAQVAYAAAYRAGGLNGVVALAGGIVALTSVGLYAALRRRGTPLLLALALALLGTGLTSITWTARAQLFSLPLTLWWSEALWAYWCDGKSRRLWLLPPVMALWANLHGGFIGGLLLLVTAAAVAWLFPGRRGHAQPRPLALALAGSLVATLATPWGLALPLHIVAYLRNPLVTASTQEYQSPDFHSLYALLFLALTGALVAAWLRLAVRRGAWPEPLALAQAALWTALACVSVRFLPLWALIVLPLLGDALTTGAALRPEPLDAVTTPQAAHPLAPLAPRWHAATGALARLSRRLEAVDGQVGRGVWSGVVVLALVVCILNAGRLPGGTAPLLDAQFDAGTFPVAAAERLHTEGLPSGRGFTTYEWGGYLDFALPEYHVFVDSRSDAYPEALLRDYATLINLGPGWQDVLHAYAIRWALLPAQAPLAQALALTPGWSCQPADSQGVAVVCLLRSAT